MMSESALRQITITLNVRDNLSWINIAPQENRTSDPGLQIRCFTWIKLTGHKIAMYWKSGPYGNNITYHVLWFSIKTFIVSKLLCNSELIAISLDSFTCNVKAN